MTYSRFFMSAESDAETRHNVIPYIKKGKEE